MNFSMQRRLEAGDSGNDRVNVGSSDVGSGDVGRIDVSSSAVHNRAEVEYAVRTLGDEDTVRLRATAVHLIRGFYIDRVQRDHDDLLSEALSRLLSGERSWRQGVDLVYQLIQIMRSIASDWRRRVVFRSEQGMLERREADLPWQPDDSTNPFQRARATESTPEASRIATVEVERIKRRLESDREAIAVIAGLEKGLSGAEIQQQTGMSKRQWLTTMQRIRRKVRRWRHDDD